MKLDAFRFTTVQSFLQILNELESEGTTDLRFVRQQVYEYVHQTALQINRRERKRGRKKQEAYKCAKCGVLAQKLPVNTSNKNVVEGDYKQVILCLSPDCMHEEWS